MNRSRRRQWLLLLLLAVVLLLSLPSTPSASARQTSTSCTHAPEAPGSVDRSLAGPRGELSLQQKHAAFTNGILASTARFEYDTS